MIEHIFASQTETLLNESSEEHTPTRTQRLYDFLTATHVEQPAFSEFVSKMCMFGAIMFYFWLTDFVHLW